MCSSKKYIIVYSVVAIFGVALTAISVFTVDPFFHYHMPWFGMKPVVNDEIHQNPGLADHATYDSIIIGSSMSENFDAKWFNEAYDIQTLKLNYSGSTSENLRISVEIAQKAKSNRLKYVFGNIDLIVLTRDFSETRFPLPQYLYDDYIYNDVYYLLNKDVLFGNVWTMWNGNKGGNVEPLEKAYMWYGTYKDDFSKEKVLNEIAIPDDIGYVEQKKPVISDNVIGAVRKIKKFVLDYPNTTFKFFYSPYSIAHWFNSYQYGDFFTDVSILEYSMRELLECENIELYFPTDYEMITDLDSYKDTEHYDMEIQYQIFEEMRDGKNQLTKDNYQEYIEEFKKMVIECDFTKVFGME